MRTDLRTEAFVGEVLRSASSGVAAVAEASRDYMQELINIPYPPASEPYHPPHRRTGYLRESCYAEPDSSSASEITWRVGNTAEYAMDLEDGITLAARPFIRPTLYGFAMARGAEVFRTGAWR